MRGLKLPGARPTGRSRLWMIGATLNKAALIAAAHRVSLTPLRQVVPTYFSLVTFAGQNGGSAEALACTTQEHRRRTIPCAFASVFASIGDIPKSATRLSKYVVLAFGEITVRASYYIRGTPTRSLHRLQRSAARTGVCGPRAHLEEHKGSN